MDRRTRRTPHASTFSLLLLESVLIASERSTPAHAPRAMPNPDEALAARLIENIRRPPAALISATRIESSRLLAIDAIPGMAARDV